MSSMMLGTAQFGTGYGITNTVGRIDDATVSSILATARESGISLFDTAADYGDAQARLGRLAPSGSHPRYVSKFGLPDGADLDPDDLFTASMDDLGVDSLHGLLFHRVADLRDPRADAVWRGLLGAVADGRIGRVGASIYDVDDLAVVAERFPDLGILQIPGNLVDRRLLDHPEVARMHDRGVEIHVRSAYLQGLLLADPAALAPHFAALAPVIAALRDTAEAAGLSRLQLALGFLARHPVVDAVLVGALSAAELGGTVAAWNALPDDLPRTADPALGDALLDPRRWPAREAS